MENTNNIKTLSIDIPKGYKIDEEKSTFRKIVFKKKEVKPWREEKDTINGYYIAGCAEIYAIRNVKWGPYNFNAFATRKQAKSALAMAQISQIMANDERFGGVITDEEWKDTYKDKYVICRDYNSIKTDIFCRTYVFLAFHTREQRDLFLQENADLIKNFYML